MEPAQPPETFGSQPEGPRLLRAPWGVRDILWVLALTIGILVILYTAAGLVVGPLGINGHAGRELGAGLIATFIFELCLFGLAAGFSVGKYGLPWARFGFRGFAGELGYLPIVGIVGAYILVAIYVAIVTGLGISPLAPSSNLPSGVFNSTVLTWMSGVEACLVAPLVEESFFRGFLFHGLLGKWVGIRFHGEVIGGRLNFLGAGLISGVLFAGFHAQIGLLIPFTLVGLLFAWIFWRSGSLWPNILAHGGFNLISFAIGVATHH